MKNVVHLLFVGFKWGSHEDICTQRETRGEEKYIAKKNRIADGSQSQKRWEATSSKLQVESQNWGGVRTFVPLRQERRKQIQSATVETFGSCSKNDCTVFSLCCRL